MADPWALPDPQVSTLASSWVTQAGSASLPAEPAPQLPASLTALCGSQWTVLSLTSNQWHQDSASVLPSALKIFSPGFTRNLGDKPIIPLAERPQWESPPDAHLWFPDWGIKLLRFCYVRVPKLSEGWSANMDKKWTEGQLPVPQPCAALC